MQTYIKTYNAALKSGDTREHRRTFDKSCAACLQGAQTIEQVYDQGSRIEGGGYTMDDIQVMTGSPFRMQARFRQAAAKILNGSGKLVKSYPATAPSYSIFKMTERSGSLVITEIQG